MVPSERPAHLRFEMVLGTPQPWFESEQEPVFLALVGACPRPVLICDYDGTLAPFMADKMQAVPYPGITERLERLHKSPTRLVFVSGRPIAELLTLVPLAAEIEIWGSHGREHRLPDGSYQILEPDAAHTGMLNQVEAALAARGYRAETERKAASIAVHWRSLDAVDAVALESAATAIFAEHAPDAAFAVMPFESGVELRVADCTKAHAVNMVLEAEPAGVAAAYLGDDTTDEDAFSALGDRGMSLLVRDQVRSSLAKYWLRPPAELLGFLDSWLAATEAGDSTHGKEGGQL